MDPQQQPQEHQLHHSQPSQTSEHSPAMALSASRKKRSTTNLADLRLAPLSSKYLNESQDRMAVKIAHEDRPDVDFSRNHPSYLQGKSAPTTPGILSRNSSRAHMAGGGLSRRGSLYDDDEELSEPEFAYGAVTADYGSGLRPDGYIPKAKSEGLLLAPNMQHRRLASAHMPNTKKKTHKRTLTGTMTPRTAARLQAKEDEWLARACVATNVLLKESKGQLWRDTSATNGQPDSTDDDDDGYEEAAAKSAIIAAKARATSANISPQMSRWSSRYGSRANSRRTSRRGSMNSTRTPLAMPHAEAASGYFDGLELGKLTEAAPMNSPVPEDRPDEDEVRRLTANETFGLGSIVDRLMGFNLFNVDERDENTDDERDGTDDETEEQARERMSAEAVRKRQEKEKLVAPPAPQQGSNGMMQIESAGWADAAWLLSVATKVLF